MSVGLSINREVLGKLGGKKEKSSHSASKPGHQNFLGQRDGYMKVKFKTWIIWMKWNALQGFLELIYLFSILFKKYLFIWLCQVLVVACRILHCGAWAQELPCSMWDLLGPGTEPSSPALEGRFLTTVPPEKSCWGWFKCLCLRGTCTLRGTISEVQIREPEGVHMPQLFLKSPPFPQFLMTHLPLTP